MKQVKSKQKKEANNSEIIADVNLLRGAGILKGNGVTQLHKELPHNEGDVSSFLSNSLPATKPFKEKFYAKYGEDLKRLKREGNDNNKPYYPEVNASAGLDFITNNGDSYSVPIAIPNVDAQAFINVFGDSMFPKYCAGEIIGIKQVEFDYVMFGQAYVIQMKNGEAYLKYIRKGKDERHWILASENKDYESREFHISKIDKIFIIKAVITKTTLL